MVRYADMVHFARISIRSTQDPVSPSKMSLLDFNIFILKERSLRVFLHDA